MIYDYIGLVEKIFTTLVSAQSSPSQGEVVEQFFELRLTADQLGLVLMFADGENKFTIFDNDAGVNLAYVDTLREVSLLLNIISMDRRNQEDKRKNEADRNGVKPE